MTHLHWQSWHPHSALLIALACLTALAPATAQESESETTLKKLEEMPLPTADELLQQHPLDWIVLRNGTVLPVKPVEPRPNTLETMKRRLEESLSWPVPKPRRGSNESEREFRDRSRRLLDDYRKRREALRYLTVRLPDTVDVAEEQEASAYRLHIEENVSQVIHHEDLVLRRIDKLLDEDNLRQSFELLLILKRRAHDWPNVEPRHNRYIYLNGVAKQKEQRFHDAWIRFAELHGRDPKYPQLQTRLGEVTSALVSAAVEADDYRRARFHLTRLRGVVPQHQVVTDWSNRFNSECNQLLGKSTTASQEARHAQAMSFATDAARIWPMGSNVRRAYSRAARRFQVLKVGVVYPDQAVIAPGFPTRHSQRYDRLTQIDLFEVFQSDDESARYRSRFFEDWTPTDLGRQAIFHLHPKRQPWESHPLITSTNIARCLRARIDPASPQYDERVATFIDSIQTRTPFEISINFSTVPIRTEPLFRFPVTVEDQTADAELDNEWQLMSSRFQLVDSTSRARIFERSVAQADRLGQYHTAQVVEHKYTTPEKAIQGLLRGEVSMLPSLPPATIPSFEKDERFLLRKYVLPITHALQIHPQSRLMKSRELRRALAYAIPRTKLLNETVTPGQAGKRARRVSAPFATTSYAYNTQVPHRDHDLRLAIALAMVARKKFGKKLPKLRFACEPDAVALSVARRLTDEWKRIGVEVDLLTDANFDRDLQPPWDLAYRTVRMEEPVFQLWPFLTLQRTARVTDLAAFPDWLRHELIELENSSDWAAVVQHLHRLHRQLHESAIVIPLWEIDDMFVVRKNIQGVPSECVHPYQDVERWIIHPWYPTDL